MAGKIADEKVRRRVQRRVRVAKTMRFTDRVALTVYRSNKHIYAQLIEPVTGRTLTSVSTRTMARSGDPGAAAQVGVRT